MLVGVTEPEFGRYMEKVVDSELQNELITTRAVGNVNTTLPNTHVHHRVV